MEIVLNFGFQSNPPVSHAISPELKNDVTDYADNQKRNTMDAQGPSAGPLPFTGKSNGTLSDERSFAAVKVQKVYRSYRTRRRLADSAVIAEELWWQAIDYVRLNHSTISFFDYLKPERAAARWNRVSLNASKVGKGLSLDAKAQILAFQHWIEAIDPRHRYGHSLHLYYEEWCKADAGQPFFYWLDIGDGKERDLKKCPRSMLRRQCIKYLGPREREHSEYMIFQGKIIHKLSGNPLDTTEVSEGKKWIFVMSTSKKLYAGVKKKGRFHHSSFLAGGATLAAGRLGSEQGVLKTISAYSGHYRPTDDSLESFLSFLSENGVNLDEVQVNKASEDVKFDEVIDAFPNLDAPIPESSEKVDDKQPLQTETSQTEIKMYETNQTEIQISETNKPNNYKRTLSGGIQSPRSDVPKTAILERINSKKQAKSYQLGHLLTLNWSTGAGPRIGCVADYPFELRTQALEFVNLSPRTRQTPNGFLSPTAKSVSDFSNGVGSSCA